MSVPGPVLLEGVIVGLNYALLAMGLVLVYRTNRIINFAQAQFGVVAAVFLVKCTQNFHFNYWFSMILAIGLAAATAAISELIARRLFNRPRLLLMVYTIGLSLFLFTFTALPFIRPSNLSAPFPVPIHTSFAIGSFNFSSANVMTLVVAPLVAVALMAFIRWSPWGLAMRAMSENADSARLSGVWVRRTSTVTWTVAGVLSAFTAILAAPGQTSVLVQPLSPDLLLLALTAALVGAMVSLPVAFVAGIAVGVVYEVLSWNISSVPTVETIMFVLLLAVLLVRVTALRKGVRSEDQSTWTQASASLHRTGDALRQRVGTVGVVAALAIAVFLPLVLSVGNDYVFSEVCLFGVIALSLTILTGWAGQVSLGQFGLVAVGAVMAAHLGSSVPLVLLMPFAGAVTAAVAVIIGLPALRVRGLYLAVPTLAFALWMQESVLATSCWTMPVLHRQLCTGLPNPASTLVARPTFLGLSLSSTQSYAWFSLGVLVLSVVVVRLWRDRGIARRLVAVRDNEFTAAAMGVPVVRTKLLAFALSGFIAGYAGVCLAFADQRFNTLTFKPVFSIQVVEMVVVGGLGSVAGAILGAIYLQGLAAVFGTNSTIQFLTGGIGVVVFVLFLPGGLAEIMHRCGDLAAEGWRWLRSRAGPLDETPPPDDGAQLGGSELDRIKAGELAG